MRVLVSLEGPNEGGTRGALGRLAFDELHVLATAPEDEATQQVLRLAERAGAKVRVDPVPGEDLLAAFDVIRQALDRDDVDGIQAQVNAGPDANLLSAAGLLACLHEGVPIHFVHEKGHTPLPVLTRAPLREMLSEAERKELSTFPREGLALEETSDRDQRALNGLKNHDLIEPEDTTLVLTDLGRSYREHLLNR